MSAIAQKLCNEICEESTPSEPSKHKRLYHASSSSRYNGRPTRSIIVEKKREVNKVVPSSSTSKSKVINKFKSKETLLKKNLIDTGLNTTITGPLKCDNDCVTMVRKRDPKALCKCDFKGLKCKTSAKEIQTIDIKHYSNLDKACTHCVETVNCGTQFFDRLSRNKIPGPLRSKVKITNEVTTQTTRLLKDHDAFKSNESKAESNFMPSKPHLYNYMGARRWALSHNPTRGPDF